MNRVRVWVTSALKKGIRKMGYDISRVSKEDMFHADMEPEFRDLYERCCETATGVEGMYALYTLIGYVCEARIPGAVVECGVYKGATSMMSAFTLLARNEVRDLYLYDTFQGMTRPSPKDRELRWGWDAHEQWAAKEQEDRNEWFYAPLDEVRGNMASTSYPQDRLRFVQGSVEETIPAVVPGEISLLRLDTDWYESTRHELEHLYPLVTPGGVVIIDDYGSWGGAKAAVDEYFEDKPVPVLKVDVTTRVVFKP